MQQQAPALIQQALARQGKTLLYVERDGKLIGLLAASDPIRPEVPAALVRLRELGIKHIELLTGDTERSAIALAEALGITYQAHLLPEDKIRVVKEYQEEGRIVVMVGDGVNDAPALAQADVGIAMGVMGTDIALEAAHAALMREDWNLVPDLLLIAKRTMRVVKMNLCFTILYNFVGLSLAAFGILPPIVAAAAQSLPDLGILANSSRLLRQKLSNRATVPPAENERKTQAETAPRSACGCGKPDGCGSCETEPPQAQVITLPPRASETQEGGKG
jgi:Cd2+/Zn2+-exporting ATPase/Cu+-exporting ATPase